MPAAPQAGTKLHVSPESVDLRDGHVKTVRLSIRSTPIRTLSVLETLEEL